jgi:hypothetical protein
MDHLMEDDHPDLLLVMGQSLIHHNMKDHHREEISLGLAQLHLNDQPTKEVIRCNFPSFILGGRTQGSAPSFQWSSTKRPLQG